MGESWKYCWSSAGSSYLLCVCECVRFKSIENSPSFERERKKESEKNWAWRRKTNDEIIWVMAERSEIYNYNLKYAPGKM